MSLISKTPEVLSSELSLKSEGFDGWFILLEGDFDQRFWSTRLRSSEIKIINCTGKSNVLGVVELLHSKNQWNKIVALVDKDFDELTGRMLDRPNLFYTDKNDLESTIICCSSSGIESVLERILLESVSGEKRLAFEVSRGVGLVDFIKAMASNYGVLRLINEELHGNVGFDNLPIIHSDYFNHSSLDQNFIEIQRRFLELINVNVIFTQADLNAKIETHRAAGLFFDWSLVQGHDFIKLLSAAINCQKLRLDSGHRQASEASLARDLCLMLHRTDLALTNMVRRLVEKNEKFLN